MKIGIIGAGAVGGYYGALLAKSGFDVHFLLKSDFEHVRKNGLVIDSKNGDFVLKAVNAYSCCEDMPKCDVVIVALKTTDNRLLQTMLPEVLKNNGIVVALQNGLDIEKDISKIVPWATVMGGLCFLCSNKIGPGHIRHLDYGSIRLGQYCKDALPAGVTGALEKVLDIFSKAAIPVHPAENLGMARWEKLVWNMSFNGTAVILNATTDRIMNNESSRAMVTEIMREVIGGAKICGYQIDDNFTETMLSATQLMVDYRPSMKIDYDTQRPLEIENIYWRPIRAVEENGGDMPKSKILAYQLNFLDQMNRKDESKK